MVTKIDLLCAALVFFSTASSAIAGGVRRVGPTRVNKTIQQAVNAASPGDLILVDAGSYGPFDVIGKSVAILSDAAPFTLTPSKSRPVIRILGVVAGQSVTVMGFRTAVPYGATAPIYIANCAGAIRIKDGAIDPSADLLGVPMRAAIEITNCRSVSLYDIDVFPARSRNGRTTNGTIPPTGGWNRGISAVRANQSNLHIVRCRFRGYDNFDKSPKGRWGGDALRLLGRSIARIDGSRTNFRGGASSDFGGCAIHHISSVWKQDVIACIVPSNAFQPGSAPNPGGVFGVNHDRGFVGSVTRFVASCVGPSIAFLTAPSRMRIQSRANIRVSSLWSRVYAVCIGPTAFVDIRGAENMGYLDYFSPLTLVLKVGMLPALPNTVVVPLVIPNLPGLSGIQFATQVALGPPSGARLPPLSLSMSEIIVIVP